MNILIPDSWLREFLKTKATPQQLLDCLSLCGPSVEKITIAGNDVIYDIEITSNRIDTVSVEGIAREAAAILPRFGIEAEFKPVRLYDLKQLGNRLPLEITDDQKLCKRIMALVLDNVRVAKSDPLISERLEKCGVRALNNLVDITNYVMLELGHPCHVFDYDRIKTNKLIIRTAKQGEKMGEKLKTLDGKTYKLENEDVIIDDGSGRIIDLPGIMGTENSVVTEDTKRILVFIESNDPVRIRKTSLRTGIRTMAATINEKNPDIDTASKTFMQAVKYYIEKCNARPASKIIDIVNSDPGEITIETGSKFINERIGVTLKDTEIEDILKSLEFQVTSVKGKFEIKVPHFRRNDVRLPIDIVEEIARIYGYQNLPSLIMTGEIPVSKISKGLDSEQKIKTMLKYWGLTEIYGYSLVSSDLIKKSGLSPDSHLKLANPLTKDLEYLRSSLVPTMLQTLSENQNNFGKINIFELAKTYRKNANALPFEESYLALSQNSSFFELKGIVEAMLSELSVNELEINLNLPDKFFHPKKYLEYRYNNDLIIQIGAIHPKLQTEFALNNEIYSAVINLEKLLPLIKNIKKFTPLPKFPPVFEDITIIVSPDLKLGFFLTEIKQAHKLISNVDLAQKFKDTVTLKFMFQDIEKNISPEELQEIRSSIKKVITGHNLKIKGNY